MAGLEERILDNLRRQPRVARPVLWKWTSAMMAAVAVVLLFAVDHLIYHRVTSNPAVVTLSEVDNSNPTALQAKAGEKLTGGLRPAKRSAASSARRQYLALNLKSHGKDIRPSSSLQVEELQITEIKLDDIVISGNDR